MKVGDKIDVTVAGEVVAQAEVREVGDGTVTFIVPASRVVMATNTTVVPGSGQSADTSGTQTIVDEVVRTHPEALGITPEASENASGGTVDNQSNPANPANTPAETEASKVITSSSVPTTNPGDPQNQGVTSLDPAVQAQINEIVAAHLAARAEASSDESTSPTD